MPKNRPGFAESLVLRRTATRLEAKNHSQNHDPASQSRLSDDGQPIRLEDLHAKPRRRQSRGSGLACVLFWGDASPAFRTANPAWGSVAKIRRRRSRGRILAWRIVSRSVVSPTSDSQAGSRVAGRDERSTPNRSEARCRRTGTKRAACRRRAPLRRR